MLHTDMSKQFESEIARHFCEILGVKKTHTTPYNPKSDSMAEWFNRILIAKLVKTLLCYRLLLHIRYYSSTGFIPCFLTHGREAYTPVDVLLGPEVKGDLGQDSMQDFILSLCKCLETAFRKAKDNNMLASRKQKSFYDTRKRHRPNEVGDLVWLSDPTASHHNLASNWKGPYVLLQHLDRNGSAEVRLGKRFPSKQSTMTDCWAILCLWGSH